jgi:hypothetical protein
MIEGGRPVLRFSGGNRGERRSHMESINKVLIVTRHR